VQAERSMETKQELEAMLKRLEAKWNKGNIGGPHEIINLDRQMKELKRRLWL
jgi:hypothetical protein